MSTLRPGNQYGPCRSARAAALPVSGNTCLAARATRRAFTLVELLVVITVMGVMVTFSAVTMAPQITLFRSQSNLEDIISALKRAQNLARARGIPYTHGLLAAPGTPNVHFGLAIFAGALQRNVNAPPMAGSSYLLFSQNDPVEGAIPVPNTTLAALSPKQKTAVRNLAGEVVVTRQWNPATPNAVPVPITAGSPLGMIKFHFFSDGSLDVAPTGLGGTNTDIGALMRTNPLPVAGDEFSSWTFDVVGRSVGWIRVRIGAKGSIVTSRINSLNQPAMTRTGQPF